MKISLSYAVLLLHWVSGVLAHNQFGPWAEPTVFATGEPENVFRSHGPNQLCMQQVPAGSVGQNDMHYFRLDFFATCIL